MTLSKLISGVALLLATAAAAQAQAQFPSKPVRMIVPVTGGSMDLFARLVSPYLSEAFGQPVVIETKAGAGGNIATEFVARSAADGHTILVAFNAPITVNPTLFAKLPFDPLKDLAPVMLACISPQFLVVHPSVPVASVKEFVEYARSRPGKLNYGSIGTGSASHLTMEMFKSAAGIDVVHVPYKGSAPATTDLLAGSVQAAFLVPTNVLPHAKAGKLKVLASSGRTRAPSLPEIPTLIESGFEELDSLAWLGLMVPAGTPAPVVERYHRELVRILALPDVRERLNAVDFEVVASTPDEFGRFIRAELAKWAPVIRRTGARAE
jgi:tripartite-type tricarboxylate transporter receptor subunit TctC